MLEMRIYTDFWNDVIERIDSTNKLLQDPTSNPNTAVSALMSLESFV